VIHEVDEGLRLLLAESGFEASGVEVVFDAPTKEWAARRSAPTLCVFLYDIREDATRRGTGAGEVHDAAGNVVARRTPPRWFDLAYLVTAWAGRPQDEHRLLTQALTCLAASGSLPQRVLTGTLAELGLQVPLDLAPAPADGPSTTDVWSALGGELKASLTVRVRAPLAGLTRRSAPPVTQGLLLQTSAGPGVGGAGGAAGAAADEGPAGWGARAAAEGPAAPGARAGAEDEAAPGGGGAAGAEGMAAPGVGGPAGAAAGARGALGAGAGAEGAAAAAEPGRRLRYTELADPGAEGFAAPRDRRPAPARRRRGERQP
jgi:hypothetical protein